MVAVIIIRAIATGILASTIAATTMVDITVDEATDMAAPSSDITPWARPKCGTQLDGAVGARGATQSKTVSANCIADIDVIRSLSHQRSAASEMGRRSHVISVTLT